MSSPISRRSLLKAAGAAGIAGLLAACSGGSSSAGAPAAGSSGGSISLTLSWWGDDARHAAYQEALAAFSRAYPQITVIPSAADQAGWESAMSEKLAAGTVDDVCQIPWDWVCPNGPGAQAFLDLQTVSDSLDLSQWDQNTLSAGQVAGAQQAVPMSMTGRIFYWNMTAFQQAGITAAPQTLDDLYAAGEAFQAQLGPDFYPLYLDGYGRMSLAVFYLESIYGQPWADPATSTLNYTLPQVIEGLDFIRDLVDRHVLMPMPVYYGCNGDIPVIQSSQWAAGQIAGVFDWDTAAARYRDALDDNNRDGFVIGEEIPFGEYKGGFIQGAVGMAISGACQHPAEAALLMDFLLNQTAGASLLGSACGIPASRSGLAAAQAAGTLDPLMDQAHSKVLASCLFQADPLFGNDALASSGGLYQQVFEEMDYGGVPGNAVALSLTDGMKAAGYIVNL